MKSRCWKILLAASMLLCLALCRHWREAAQLSARSENAATATASNLIRCFDLIEAQHRSEASDYWRIYRLKNAFNNGFYLGGIYECQLHRSNGVETVASLEAAVTFARTNYFRFLDWGPTN